MAAKLSGCTEIVAVDLKPDRLSMTERLGATATVNPETVDDVVETVRDLTGAGPDYALETTGVPDVAEQAVASLTWRGTMGVIGAPALGAEASYEVNDLILNGRTITGIVEGDADPQRFIPDLIDLYREGSFPFDELVTYYELEDLQAAVADAESGEVIKPVVRMSAP
jgi:aryl-alcohol dehydrogenase